MKNLHGLYAALATPYAGDGSVSEKCLRSLVNFVLDQKIGGLYVGGSTGEALLQGIDERTRILQVVADEARERARLIGQVGAISTRDACRLAQVCAKEGYHAISAIPPIYFPYSKEEILQYYRTLADAAGELPLIVYNVPALSGVKFTTDDLAALIEIPGVKGIKQTSLDLYQTEQLRRRYPDLVILNGYDEIFLPALAVGVDGGIGSTFNIMGNRFNKILRLFNEGRNKEALVEQSKCNEIIDALVVGGVFTSIKYVLYKMGVIENPTCREPLPSVPRGRLDVLDAIGEALLQEFQKR